MSKKPLFTKFSPLYGIMLFLAIYFMHHDDSFRISVFGQTHTIGLVFLAWVSTFRDFVQLSGARMRGIFVLFLVCGTMYFMFDSEVATKATVALIWTELIDFALFTVLWKSTRSFFATVISDLVAIPLLWVIVFALLGYPLSALPPDTMTVQYLSLTVLYVILGVVCLRSERASSFLGLRKVR